MNKREEWDFLNGKIWLDYTQKRYTSLDDIKYRLDKRGISQKDWHELKLKIQMLRKMGSIPFFVKSLNKHFWYYPSDSINQKIHHIEQRGTNLYELIKNHSTLEKEFLANARVEESITSAIYEGANSTRSQARALIASGKKARNKNEWMLLNNLHAMEWIKKYSHSELSHELILQIHKIVSANTLEGDDANFCGRFRNDTVFVGKHEGIEHSKIELCLQEIIANIAAHPRFIHALIIGILLHYFVAYIHPFFDGNGRTARTLFYFKAIKSDLKFVELLSISADLKSHGKKYERSFELVLSHDLDVTFFIDFCLNSLVSALDIVERKVDYLLSVARLDKPFKLNPNKIALLQRMALNKYREISIEEYARQIGKSREVARQELQDLSEKNFLKREKRKLKFIYRIDTAFLKKSVSNYKSERS